jgi:hypothetical protein
VIVNTKNFHPGTNRGVKEKGLNPTNDEKCKPTSITGLVYITSLNPHSAGLHAGTIFCRILRQKHQRRMNFCPPGSRVEPQSLCDLPVD